MRRGDQAIEIFERAEQRIDIAIIGYVIAEISHWRGIERRYPDRVNAERDEIAKPALDALQVANAVAIGIEERAGIDLIKCAPLPPQRVTSPTFLQQRHPAASSDLFPSTGNNFAPGTVPILMDCQHRPATRPHKIGRQ